MCLFVCCYSRVAYCLEFLPAKTRAVISCLLEVSSNSLIPGPYMGKTLEVGPSTVFVIRECFMRHSLLKEAKKLKLSSFYILSFLPQVFSHIRYIEHVHTYMYVW